MVAVVLWDGRLVACVGGTVTCEGGGVGHCMMGELVEVSCKASEDTSELAEEKKIIYIIVFTGIGGH